MVLGHLDFDFIHKSFEHLADLTRCNSFLLASRRSDMLDLLYTSGVR